MADDLKRLVQPDERVLFEAGGSYRNAVGAYAAAVATPVAAAIGLAWFGDGGLWTALIGGGGALLPTLLFAGRDAGAALVTDIRVIYRQGLLRPSVTEIPLWHIAAIERATGRVILAGRGGETVELPSLAHQQKVAHASLRQTDVQAPDSLSEAAAEAETADADYDDDHKDDDD